MAKLSQLIDNIQNLELRVAWLCESLGISSDVAVSWFCLFLISVFAFLLSQLLIAISDLRK